MLPLHQRLLERFKQLRQSLGSLSRLRRQQSESIVKLVAYIKSSFYGYYVNLSISALLYHHYRLIDDILGLRITVTDRPILVVFMEAIQSRKYLKTTIYTLNQWLVIALKLLKKAEFFQYQWLI